MRKGGIQGAQEAAKFKLPSRMRSFTPQCNSNAHLHMSRRAVKVRAFESIHLRIHPLSLSPSPTPWQPAAVQPIGPASPPRPRLTTSRNKIRIFRRHVARLRDHPLAEIEG
jgi:hypothetical protein